MKKCFIFTLCFVLAFQFCSCKKNTSNKTQEIPAPNAHPVAILFGYGFNDDEFVNKMTSLISEKYGLAENNGPVSLYVFPRDFSMGGVSGRISSLADFVQEKDCKSLITFGAPEFTHKALAKLQDAESDCFVISLFSQDDALATEAGSDIVLDFAEQEKAEDAELDVVVESGMQHMDKMEQIVMQTIKSVVPENLFKKENTEAVSVISNLYGDEWEVVAYVDSTTGLRAKNHFVLKYIEKPTETSENPGTKDGILKRKGKFAK